MAPKELMSWIDKESRWTKNYKGKIHAVTAYKLMKLYPDLCNLKTRAGTREAANKWWSEREREFGYADDPAYQNYLDSRNQHLGYLDMIQSGELKIPEPLDATAFAKRKERIEKINQASKQDTTLTDRATKWIESKPHKGQVVLRSQLIPALDANPVKLEAIDSIWVDDVATWIRSKKISLRSKANIWSTVKQFLAYLDSLELIVMPRRAKSIKFAKGEPTVDPPTVDWVRTVLENLDDSKERAWILLMLNCCYTQSDVAELLSDEILDGKRIKRKRTKQAHTDSTPVVDYPLWHETQELLAKYGSKNGLVFTGPDGSKLVNQNPRKDSIAAWWDRFLERLVKDEKIEKTYTLKQFRKLGRNLLEDSSHSKYAKYFQGHSIVGVDQHYLQKITPKRQAEFDDAVGWLRGCFFS